MLPGIGNIGGSGYQTNNSELMAMLMDQVVFPAGGATINAGHVKNPQQTHFLDAKMVSDTVSPGVGTDLVYRDPFNNPYIITLDANGDNRCRDGFYRSAGVSQKTPGSPIGYNGLNNTLDTTGAGSDYEANVTVMVWSLGPDYSADPTVNANTGLNKDNIIGW